MYKIYINIYVINMSLTNPNRAIINIVLRIFKVKSYDKLSFNWRKANSFLTSSISAGIFMLN